MIIDFFYAVLYQPIYNGLVFLISVLPYGDVGLAVILLTILVKFLIFPFTHKSVKVQARLRRLEPEIKKLKEQFKKDKQEQARKTMELYKEHGINPFSGCTLFLIQIPVILALYWVFWKGLTNGIDESSLYSFVVVPDIIRMKFLGIIDMGGKSIFLALLAGVTQYFQMKYAMPQLSNPEPEKHTDGKITFKEEFAKSFKLQMKYGLPVIVFFVSYTISAVVALYWTTSNLFSITHELFVKRKAEHIKKD